MVRHFRPGQVLAHSVASIEQASSGIQFTIAHQRGPSSWCRGSPYLQRKKPRQWTLTVQECTVFVRPRENDRYSPRILHGYEQCGNSVESLYGMVVAQATVKPAGGEYNERNLRYSCSPGAPQMMGQEFNAMSDLARETSLMLSSRSSIGTLMFRQVSTTDTLLTDQRIPH